MKNIENISDNGKKRVVIVGAGFAGISLVKKLSRDHFQVLLIDKNNYHQFQPLFYQVATAGLEPSAIAFPVRRMLQGLDDTHFRMASATNVDPASNELHTTIGKIKYDYLVLAMGASTNYFGMKDIEQNSIPMKSLEEALFVRNVIILNFEEALNYKDPSKAEHLFNVCIVGGGPTGVELAGALSEMKKYVLPKDYPELKFDSLKIYLLELSDRLLNTMSVNASEKAKKYLEKMGVAVMLKSNVKSYDGLQVTLSDNRTLPTKTLIWAAGVQPNAITGLPGEAWSQRGRLLTDEYNRIKGHENIFAAGDMAMMVSEQFPNGHPQVAQTAIQQSQLISQNIKRLKKGKTMLPFRYSDKGSLATIGRHLAVADLPYFKFQGFFAWLLWGVVHLVSIVGVKNKLFILLDWMFHYFSYDQALRLLIGRKRSTYL